MCIPVETGNKTSKLFATIKFSAGLKVIDINVDKPVKIIELLKIVSGTLNFDLIKKLTRKEQFIPAENILHKQKPETIIDNDTIIPIFPAIAGVK